MPKIVHNFVPRPAWQSPLLVLQTFAIVGLIAYIILYKDSGSIASLAGEPFAIANRWAFPRFLIPNFLL